MEHSNKDIGDDDWFDADWKYWQSVLWVKYHPQYYQAHTTWPTLDLEQSISFGYSGPSRKLMRSLVLVPMDRIVQVVEVCGQTFVF